MPYDSWVLCSVSQRYIIYSPYMVNICVGRPEAIDSIKTMPENRLLCIADVNKYRCSIQA